MDSDGRGSAEEFERITRLIAAAAAQHRRRIAAERAPYFRQAGVAEAAVVPAKDDDAVAVEDADRGKRRESGVRDDRLQRGRGLGRAAIGRHRCPHRRRLLGQSGHCIEVDRGSLRHELARLGRSRRAAVPGRAVGAGEGGALGDQLGFGLLDERVLIDPQEDGGDPRKRRDEQQDAEQDRPQPESGPEALRKLLQRPDQPASPRQEPIR
jgi:hypothetical protein